MRIRRILLTASLCAALPAAAAPPVFHTQSCSVSVDGNRLDTVLTPDGNALRNTFAYDPITRLWNFWGFLLPDNNYPSAASSLRAVVHATSTDGVHFTSDGNLSYAFGSANYMNYGSTIDPPLNFLRAIFDTSTSTWKLFNWTDNEGTSVVGSYNYNTSVNDLGTIASTTNVVHQGPLNSPVSGNHVGTFGLISGMLYLRSDNNGGADSFAYADGAYPWNGAKQPSTGNVVNSSDLYTGTPYCWFLSATANPPGPPLCANTSQKPAYVHNAGRTLLQPNNTLGTFYAYRIITDSSGDSARADQQVWYAESSNGGTNWSTPVGVFANGGALTIDGQPQDSAPGTGLFSDVDLVLDGTRYQLYFSTQDANGNYVMVSTQGRPSDAIFFDGFDTCD